MTTQAMIVSAEKMKHIIWSEIIATSFHSDCIISLVLSASFCSSRSSVSFSKFLTIFPNCFSITRSSSVIKNLEPGVSNKLLALLALSEQSESSYIGTSLDGEVNFGWLAFERVTKFSELTPVAKKYLTT